MIIDITFTLKTKTAIISILAINKKTSQADYQFFLLTQTSQNKILIYYLILIIQSPIYSGRLRLMKQSQSSQISDNSTITQFRAKPEMKASDQPLTPLLSDQKGHDQAHSVAGQLLKSIVYGAVDGTVNTTIVILSGISSDTPLHSIFAIAICSIVAGALDMACCDYVSVKAQIAYAKRQQEREFYEVRNMLAEEKKQIVKIYQEKNYELQDCIRLSELYATNQQAFVNIMMLQQLKLVAITDQSFPMKCSIATFLSFLMFGLVTVSPYILQQAIPSIEMEVWPFVIIICSLELISLGFAKALILGISRVKSALQISLMGSVAIGVGYGVGMLFPAN